MKLLTVGSLPPEWGGPLRGGVATFHAALLTALLERWSDVKVMGTLPPGPLDREIPIPAFIRPEDVDRASFYGDLLERLQPDVVLMNHVANTVGVTHARLRPLAPAVGVVHSWHNVTFRSGKEREGALALTQEALDGLDAMVVPSRHALEEGRALGFRYPAIAEAIHHPVPPLYMADDIDVSADERRDVVFFGSLVSRKRPFALVEAAALLPEMNVVLVGEGELEQDLKELISRRSLGGRVRLAGGMPGPDHLRRVREMLLNARAVCLPSRSESFGFVFIEALACGTPVIGFGPTVREIRDTVGIEIGLPLDSGEPEEIAAAIESVLAVDWDRDELRRATLDRFGLDRVTDRYIELFSRIVRSSGGA